MPTLGLGLGLSVASNQPAESPFSPINIPGLQLWLKADAGVILSSGNLVSEWQDQSGNGKHATTVNSGSSPVYISNAYGGKPAIQFDNPASSGQTYMSIPSPSFNLKNSTCFAVAKQNSLTLFARIFSLLSSSGEDYNSDDALTFCFLNYFNELQAISNGATAGLSGALADGVYAIPGYSVDADGEISVFYNGSEGDYAGSNGSMTGQNGGDFYIAQGSQVSPLSALDGEIAEILIYDSVLSPANKTLVNTYLQEKYQLL